MENSKQIIETYAKGIFKIARIEDAIEKVERCLTLLKEAINGNKPFEELLNNPKVSSDDKKAAISGIMGKKLCRIAYNFLNLMIDHSRGGLILGVIDEFFLLCKTTKEVVVVDMTTAVPLSYTAFKRLKEELSDMIGGEIHIRRHVDGSLLGGMVLRIGDTQIDASTRGKLYQMKKDVLKMKAIGG